MLNEILTGDARELSKIKRFYEKIDKRSTQECWNWLGYKTRLGYGQFGFNRKLHYAHRFSYELTKGQIPTGLVLDHLCRNPSCCNPDHLEPVPQVTNIERGTSPCAKSITTIKTLNACAKGHPFTEENILTHKNGTRHCKTCKLEADKSRRRERYQNDPQYRAKKLELSRNYHRSKKLGTQ